MNRRACIRALAAGTAVVGLWYLIDGAAIHAKAALAQHLLHDAWTRTGATGKPTRPWPWADVWPVARLEVPRLGVSQVVLSGSSGEALAFGPGQMHNSTKHQILAGHRDTSFRFLKDIRIGDEILFTTPDGKTGRYRVSGTAIANADTDRIETASAGRRMTLITCYPFDSSGVGGPLRYIVIATA